MEIITLAVPEVTPTVTTTTYRVVRLVKDLELQFLEVRLRGSNGETKEFRYSGDVAVTFIRALNKANLSVKSEQTRIIEQLVADGKIAGVVSGPPD